MEKLIKILKGLPGKLIYADKNHRIHISFAGKRHINLHISEIMTEPEYLEFKKHYEYIKLSKSSCEYLLFTETPFKKWYNYKLTPYFDSVGRLEYYSLYIEDITEKKQLEQRILETNFIYYEAFKSIGIGIWEYSRDLRMFNISDTLKKLLKLNKNLISLEEWITLIHPDDWKTVEKQLKETIKIKSDKLLIHTYRVKQGNEYIWVNSLGRVIKYNQNGEPVKSLGIIQDITEQVKNKEKLREYNKKLEKEVKERTLELQRAKKEAESSNKAKSEFLSNISYEFFTLLNIILNSAEIMERKIKNFPTSEDLKKTLKNIKVSADSLNTLVKNMLFLTKLDLNTIKFKYYKTDIIGLLKSLSNEIKTIYNKDIEIEINSTLRYIYCDSMNIKTALSELIINSIKHGGENTKIKIIVSNDENNMIFEVSDNGKGVPVDKINNIFERFYSLNKATKGLGLSICKEIINKHNGKIKALAPKNGQGLTVTFTLPLNGVTNENT